MADSDGSRFTVSTAQPVLDKFRRWAGVAARLGLQAEYLAALKQVNHHLESDPDEWGDILKEYRQIDAVERRGMVPQWFVVWYGVHASARLVVVKEAIPAPGSPLLANEAN